MNSITAEVYILDVPYSADNLYSYHVPKELEHVRKGSIVEVPFGKGNRRKTAVVFSLTVNDGSVPERELKYLSSEIGNGLILDDEMLSLCTFLKEHTLCTFGEALSAVVPSSAFGKVSDIYEVNQDMDDGCGEKLTARAEETLELCRQLGRFTKNEIVSASGFDCTRYIAELEKKGYLLRTADIKKAYGSVTRIVCDLAEEFKTSGSANEILARSEYLKLRGKNKKKVFEFLALFGESSESDISQNTGISLPACRSAVKALAGEGLIRLAYVHAYRDKKSLESSLVSGKGQKSSFVLSESQEKAFDALLAMISKDGPSAALLHGVTGSGKTNVIIKLIEKTLEMGRGVIMLVPEIALTPQTVMRFAGVFGDRIALIHSSLSQGERVDAWRRIRSGKADVVIGTRSAIFAPVKNLGLIVIDEEHEHTYKSDSNPKYQAHEVASFRCGENGASLILASATPSVTSYYKAKKGIYSLVELKDRYGEAKLPDVVIADSREDIAEGNLSPIGKVLAEKLREDSAKGYQSILFLNRRGYNNFVSCRSCLKNITCPNCSVTMKYHSRKGRSPDAESETPYLEKRRNDGYLVCHMCGYKAPVPEVCPSCGKPYLMFLGSGTQKAEDDIINEFPELKILRMDHDTISLKHSHEEILTKFRNGEANVLLGTQMVTKGHDFPRVATVGVLNSDMLLTADDYRASERTFAMLTQVVGRAGRADVPGVAVIQTRNPENRVIRLAARQDYVTFYNEEIKLRKAVVLPPFCDIAVITLASMDEKALSSAIDRLYRTIIIMSKNSFSDVPITMFGPFEAPVYKAQNVYRKRIILKCRLNKKCRQFMSEIILDASKHANDYKRENDMDRGNHGYKSRNMTTVNASIDINPNNI